MSGAVLRGLSVEGQELRADAGRLRTLVATFLAVLELTRLKRLRIRQDEAFSDILCEAVLENGLETAVAPSTVTA